ncbi:selenium cofactor biosynthesis protein YqeC [Endozoicomonas gorgoniicola]|uniref:Selenium cofactor biosynthesis protein YqeC n=1 Tax=Endozoicomonas gorgoniicola TaxID=1234144 RepID=A0ABT3MPX2_9GAMM|nr:selenium cofactor biosynthesis protein YqeC [Endozoicomonas gorgoniicola]MCW7551158.1 selenium cofactor biosynthesis protein YqeC [Endozoicomonas gorgoniicola]
MIPGIDPDKDRIIAATGAGGKTCFLQHLARLLQQSGRTVLLSTTTHIYHPDVDGFANSIDRVICCTDAEELYNSQPEPASITVAGMMCKNPQKLSGIPANLPAELIKRNLYDNILIEADGSHRLPLKAPSEKEPVLPDGYQVLVGVTGWKGIESPITADTVHRREWFSAVTGLKTGDSITPEAMSVLINSSAGLFKQPHLQPDSHCIYEKEPSGNNFSEKKCSEKKPCKKIWLLNQLDSQKQRQSGRAFALEVLAHSPSIHTTLLSSFSQLYPWLERIKNPSLYGSDYDQ